MNDLGGKSNQKFADYIVLWNAGAGVAYVFASIIAIVICLEHYSGMHPSSLMASNTSFAQEFSLAMISLLISIAIAVLNIMYAQKYLRHDIANKSKIGLAATIGFLVLVGFQLCRSVSSMATYFNANRIGAADGILTLLDMAIWGPCVFSVINAMSGVFAFWYIFKKAEMAEDIVVTPDGEVKEERRGIAAEVATHAMGRPEPSPEMLEEIKSRGVPSQEMNDPIDGPKREAEKIALIKSAMKRTKKELPPILSANPDNELLGKINREERTLKIGVPTFASPDEVARLERGHHYEDERYRESVHTYEEEKRDEHHEHQEEHEKHEEHKEHEERHEEDTTLPTLEDDENVLPVNKSDDY